MMPPTVHYLDLRRDPRKPERWVFAVRIYATGVALTINHLLATPTPDGWEVRMPEDREHQPIVRLPTSWNRAIRTVISAEIERRTAKEHAA